MCILQLSLGLPTVKYCAKELFLSTNYFGDLRRQITGDTAGNIIRRFVMAEAQKQLISGTGITATAEHLGFDYPQHFTRMFKKHFGESPTQYLRRMILQELCDTLRRCRVLASRARAGGIR